MVGSADNRSGVRESKGGFNMLRDEWLAIGYEKGLIEDITDKEQVSFETAYYAWFKTKINRIRPQSVDRIEVTYNKYYAFSDFVKMPVHSISENSVYTFLNKILIERGNITKKEYGRIYQIVNNVMQYAYDLKLGHAYCVNWSIVKRYIALENIQESSIKEFAISAEDRECFARAVLIDKVYSEKRSASLVLLLNFYLGLRIGELAALRWQDIDFKDKSIFVHGTEVKAYERDENGERVGAIAYHAQDKTKTAHSVRRVPLVNESIFILNELKKWHESQGYESEFLAYDGMDQVLTRSLEWTLRRICILCEIPLFNSHRIRKTFATELHQNGVPTNVISDLMGHAEIRTTEQSYIISSSDSFTIVRDVMKQKPIIDLALC